MNSILNIRFKSIFALLVFYFMSFSAFGQLGAIRIETEKFKLSEAANFHYIPMDFNHSDIDKKVLGLDASKVVSVSLVYTQFKLSERFDQLALNQARIDELFKYVPQLKSNKSIKWYLVAQTGCNTPGDCRGFFHGFEIKTMSEDDLKKDFSEKTLTTYYKNLYSGKTTDSHVLDSLIETGKSSIIRVCDTTYRSVENPKNRVGKMLGRNKKSKQNFIKNLNKKGFKEDELIFWVDAKGKMQVTNDMDDEGILKSLKSGFRFTSSRYQGEKSATQYTLKFSIRNGKIKSFTTLALPIDSNRKAIENFQYSTSTEQVINCSYVDTSVKLGTTFLYENVVTKVLDRNKDWSNCVVATDVTGSMSPYIGQFLAWHQLHLKSSSKNTDFVFFNDGDNMADYLKITGEVGGLYYIKTNNYTTLEKTLNKAQTAGCGGDGPENNIEAGIYGLEVKPDAKGIIMIADNYATPRDLELLSQIKVPIHVIVCGAQNGVNLEYLNMIRENGGSLHTIEEDITNLAKLTEGEVITILGTKYKVTLGKLVPAIS
ncbi:MAG: hypothetical protein H6607_04285 [Flavobacteriales bacterium]|nr:hypothetical protein [Flavobacteriales bacterium]